MISIQSVLINRSLSFLLDTGLSLGSETCYDTCTCAIKSKQSKMVENENALILF